LAGVFDRNCDRFQLQDFRQTFQIFDAGGATDESFPGIEQLKKKLKEVKMGDPNLP
jgi:hypothetical protein